MKTFLTIIVCLSFLKCASPKGDTLFYPSKNLGKVSKELKEASGLVASINNPGKLWTINDSGNGPDVFLINDQAKIELICKLKNGRNQDWEDVTIGPGPDAGKNYLYIGDIGDNGARHKVKTIYRFQEPTFNGGKNIVIENFETIILKLPDQPRDTETLMIDPITQDLIIISKREDSVIFYRAKYPFGKETITMDKLEKLPYHLIVAGSISGDGQEVLLKSYNKIFYWKRVKDEPISKLLLREPVQLQYEPEHQGEAIAWARDSSGFYTLSESSVVDRAQLRFYKRKRTIAFGH